MKVALVSPYSFDAHGGVQDQVSRLVGWLRAEGIEAWAVAPGGGGPEGTRSVGEWRSIPANRSRAPISIDPRAAARTAEAVADADVVHVHEPFMPIVSLGAVLKAAPPLVGTFHADPSAIARGAYRIGRRLVRRLGRRLAVTTAVSEVAASAIRGIGDVRLIPNGIDLPDEVAPPAKRSAGTVLFIGRDEERKGLDVLLEAWPRVLRDAPGARLRVVGAERPGGPAGVEFLGRVDERTKLAELEGARVLVAPNLGGESFGIVVLEGLAHGCGVVASDLPSFRAVAGDAARFVEPDQPIPLAAEIAALLSDEPALERAVISGMRRARLFGKESILPAYVTAYRDAIGLGA